MDDVSGSAFLSLILGLPIIIGISILSIPFIIVAAVTGISLDIVVKSILVFGLAVFIIWIFCRYQIIENGIVGHSGEPRRRQYRRSSRELRH